MARSIGGFVLCLAIPGAAFAEAYRCKQPDGSPSFQDRPCATGAVGTPITVSPAAGNGDRVPSGQPAAADAWKERERESQRRRDAEQAKAYNDDVMARNRMQRCNVARNQLGILKEPRPAYRRDDAGNRQYVKDEDRQAEVAAATRRVNEECS